MERQLRKGRKLATAYKAAGNMEDYKNAKARITAMLTEYKKFSSAMNVKTDYNRIYVDGLGRI